MEDFKINFVTHSPFPNYVNYIGGLMVCHSLAHDIATLGESSFLSANSTKLNYSCSLIPWNSQISYDPENTILIQGSGADHVFQHLIPDSIKSIPNVVRWLMGDQSYSYSEDEVMLQIFGNDYNKMKMTDKDIMDVVFNKKTEKMY